VQGYFEQVIFSPIQALGNLVSGEKKVNIYALFFVYRIEYFGSLLCIHLQAYVRVITIPNS